MKVSRLALSVLVSCGVSACSGHFDKSSQSVGNLQPDQQNKYQAVSNASTTSVQIVKEYVPVPIPGQLMPAPGGAGPLGPRSAQDSPVFLSKADAVKYANQHALQEPQSQDFFNAMMSYEYMPDALYTIYTAPLKITDVSFGAGEKIISIAAGDTLRWQMSQTYSGTGAQLQQHLLIKPNSGGLQNTVVITSSVRVYHLALISSADGTYMVSVSWHYPDDMVQFGADAGKTGPAAANDGAAASGTPGLQLDLGSLDFAYRFGLVAGNKPAWYPERVFNNGRQTFIQFPSSVLKNNAPLPMLFVADNNQNYGTMYNWRQKGAYMVIDSVIHQAKLQTGVDKKDMTVVQIEYTGMSS